MEIKSLLSSPLSKIPFHIRKEFSVSTCQKEGGRRANITTTNSHSAKWQFSNEQQAITQCLLKQKKLSTRALMDKKRVYLRAIVPRGEIFDVPLGILNGT